MPAFNIRESEYQATRFVSPGGPIRIQLRATAPVVVRVFPADRFEAFQGGQLRMDSPWRRAAYLDEQILLAPGPWIVVIEGDVGPSGGVLELKMPIEGGGPSGPSGPIGTTFYR